MTRHRIDISERHKARLDSFAAHQGQSSAAILRGIIERMPAVADSTDAQAPPRQNKVTIRLTDDECAMINRLAEQAGFAGRATWVQALVRANLDKQPMLTHEEIRTVEKASRQLAHVGRNLNQMARALNIDAIDAERPTVTFLRDLKHEIDAVKKAIRELSVASRQQWSV